MGERGEEGGWGIEGLGRKGQRRRRTKKKKEIDWSTHTYTHTPHTSHTHTHHTHTTHTLTPTPPPHPSTKPVSLCHHGGGSSMSVQQELRSPRDVHLHLFCALPFLPATTTTKPASLCHHIRRKAEAAGLCNKSCARSPHHVHLHLSVPLPSVLSPKNSTPGEDNQWLHVRWVLSAVSHCPPPPPPSHDQLP